MKRRGFLGFMGGAAVAGPGMVKEAAAKAVADLSLGRAGMLAGAIDGGMGMPAAGAPSQYDMIQNVAEMANAKSMLEKIVGISASQFAQLKQQQAVYALDPDIAAYRSISLVTKIDWQRERQVRRTIDQRKTMFQRVADGLGYGSDNPF